MIKASELRLGSLFEYKGGIYSAQVIRDNFVYGKNIKGFAPGEFPIKDIEPIPLDEEWLVKLGWATTGTDEVGIIYYKKRYSVSQKFFILIYRDGKIDLTIDCEDSLKGLTEIKFVHHLQNIIHALTGEELEIIKEK